MRSNFAKQIAALLILVCGIGNDRAAVIRWGNGANGYNQSQIPNNLTNVLAIAAGFTHSLALRQDGTVVGWGSDTNYGQINIPIGLTNVTAISAGGFHSLARKSDGTVVAWGAGDGIQSGNYQYGQSIVPTGLSNVVAISAGEWHSMALKTDGTVVVWGGIGWGGSADIPSGLSGVAAISAGYTFCMALKTNGTVVAWGNSPGGPVPVTVPTGLNGIVAISAGTYHALALKADGTVFAWNWSQYGSYLTNVPAGLSNVVAIAAGQEQSLALKIDGSVVGWGNPQVPTIVTGATQIAAGFGYALGAGPNAAMSPQILVQPTDQSVASWDNALFQTKADGGSDPLVYQWRFNGIPIPGATNEFFYITNAQVINAGNYSVEITNHLGIADSATAKLFVTLPNDNFVNASAIPPTGGRMLGSTSGATKEVGEPSHAGNNGGASVWFTWNAPTDCSVTLDTIGSSFDTLLAVYTGNVVSNLSLVMADDDGAGYQLNSKLSFSALAGTTYHIAVDGYGGSSGAFILNLATVEPLVCAPNMGPNGVFTLQARGPVGQKFIVDSSTNLVNWLPFATSSIPTIGIISITDSSSTNTSQRFFRMRSQ
jgi:alpha-tubulin suppressor-like RCC1 family protein